MFENNSKSFGKAVMFKMVCIDYVPWLCFEGSYIYLIEKKYKQVHFLRLNMPHCNNKKTELQGLV